MQCEDELMALQGSLNCTMCVEMLRERVDEIVSDWASIKVSAESSSHGHEGS